MPAQARFPSAAGFVPDSDSLPVLADAASGCHGCDLYEDATQTVFGAGPPTARLVLVGEQPGDVEDRRGEPFVGPAGALLDRALDEAGVDRSVAYVTNAVKHFRWRRAGSRRIHEKPAAAHVNACRPWLVAELTAIDPVGVVALGATAAQTLFGSAFRLTAHRGELLDWPPGKGAFAGSPLPIRFAVATLHPSAVLRADDADRDAWMAGLVADLRLAGQALDGVHN